MRNIVQEYLENKENNIYFERLLYRLHQKYGINFEHKVDYESNDNGAINNVYPYSNEFLNEIFKDVNLDGGRALVVGSSGDQALHSVLAGAKEVTLMDGNMWAKPFVELKLAAFKNLSFDEFNDYFSTDLETLFNHRYYSKVSHDLSEQSKSFWDNLILECTEEEELFNISSAFMLFNFGNRARRYHCYYSSEKMFNKLKEKLGSCNINFVVADVSQFPEYAKGTW